jgi:putative DNA primase/helicase
LLVFRDEVVSLLKSLDREGQEEGRGFYLTAWNGDSPYTFDRIGRGLNLHIPALCISLLGGTQPGRLSEYIHQAVKGGSADDGLIQRFGLLIWPDLNGTWANVDRYPDTEAKNRAFQVFDELDRLDPLAIGADQDTDFEGQPDGIPYLRFEPAALELFTEWRTALESKLRSDLHPALESHYAKYRKLIPSLALIIHLADGGTGPVSEDATLRALAWGEYLETHAERAYSSVSKAEVSTAKAILRRIKKGDLKPPFTSHAVWRPGWSKLSDRDQVMNGLRMLEDYNHIYMEKVETGGRAKTLYHMNEVK